MKGNEIRELFLQFFKDKGHLVRPSFSLVPVDDPTLLLIAAGMAPLKPFFTGKMLPPHSRMATSQKCIRTNDIENVGKTARHHTFFEMLGNFSFGDYFKKEAIFWGWEFVTQYLKLEKERLWVSIYTKDDEAFEIWHKEVGLPTERIIRMEDNFWEIGTGPCGPCSEIYVDMGEDFGCNSPSCMVGCDCDRYLEIWNLVFTQFDKDDEGNYNPLAKKNIDTGAGLERLASVMQGKRSNFETDLVYPIIEHICKLANVVYGQNEKTDISLKVIADHVRSLVIMVCDGILPSNEGRGYVLRRILRRAVRHGKLLGIEKLFLCDAIDVVAEIFEKPYPEILERLTYIKKIVLLEEERFNKTLQQGLELLNKEINLLKKEAKKQLPGTAVFKLYDTFGFPWELTQEILEENALILDMDGFEKAMAEQKERARNARQESKGFATTPDLTSLLLEPTMYVKDKEKATIVAFFDENKIVEEAADGDDIAVILNETAFYPEGGGQVADTGQLVGDFGIAQVYDVRKLPDGTIYHLINIQEGVLKKGEQVKTIVDQKRNWDIARNHTATHLLQFALRKILGEHVQQSGSMVMQDRLRFDFTHFEMVDPLKLQEIENFVNRLVLEAHAVNCLQMKIEEAKKMGAMALFGEKYSENVRVVSINNKSIELCGGCHVQNTAEIGLFKIINEESVGAGLRRIEAVTGYGALKLVQENEQLLNQLTALFKVNKSNVLEKAELFIEKNQELEKEITSYKNEKLKEGADGLLNGLKDIKGLKVLVSKVKNCGNDSLRQVGDFLRSKLNDGIIVLASVVEDKAVFIIMVFGTALKQGLHAGNLIKETAKIAGGGGGGKPDMAQAGGRDPEKIDEALQFALEKINAILEK